MNSVAQLEVLRAQWTGSALLRWGTLAALALLWVYGLLWVSDQAALWRNNNEVLRQEIAQLTLITRETAWPQRATELRLHQEALQTMLWQGRDVAVVEAELQDWLRATAARWTVGIRSLELTRDVPEATSRGATAAGVSAAAAHRTLRVRLVLDVRSIAPVLGYLSELGQSPRRVLVDRTFLRLAAAPATAELELRVLVLPARAAGEAGR